MTDAREIGCDPVPVIIALDCAAAASPQSLCQSPVIEKTTQGTADLIRVFGIDQEASLPIPYRLRDPTASSAEYRYPTG
jgi:hypothetical protein